MTNVDVDTTVYDEAFLWYSRLICVVHVSSHITRVPA